MLSRAELALARGWAQGLPLQRLASLYLDFATPGATRHTLESIRQRLVERARRHQREDLANAFGHSIEPWPQQTDLILQTLDRLNLLGDPLPALHHAPAEWLPETLAIKVGPDRGIKTFGDLLRLMDTHGYYWWKSVPKLGATNARRILLWLVKHQKGFGRSLPDAVVTKPLRPRQPVWAQRSAATVTQSAIVPLEQIQYPVEEGGNNESVRHALSGVESRNRAPVQYKNIDADDDLTAIWTWLRLRPAGSPTFRAYRKEAERFLLWAMYQRRKALSDLNVNDCIAYRDFLAALDPESGVAWEGPIEREQWIGEPRAARGQDPWRPFAGPLSHRSQQQAMTILKSMAQWFVETGYWMRSPFAGVPLRVVADTKVDTGRAFTQAQWLYILKYLDQREAENARQRRAHRRMRFVLYLAFGTGMRLFELASSQLRALSRHSGEGLEDWFWVLTVIGKRNKKRVIPLPDIVAQELSEYLATRGIPLDLKNVDLNEPLIGRLRRDDFAPATDGTSRKTLGTSTLAESLKTFFRDCAEALKRDGFDQAAERLARASTHWLRHTHGTLGVKAGIDLATMQDSLGHDDLGTTGIYVSPELIERKRQMDKLFSA